ncbi:MAG: hypothetical protein QOI61_1236 [Actinomycetota bacterium]
MRRLAIVGLIAGGLLLPNTPAAQAATSPNLVKNPGGDAAPGGGDGTALVAIPNWTRTVNATTTKYSTGGGFPTASDPGPANRGVAFFSGGNGGTSTLTQNLTLSAAHVNKIKTGAVKLNAVAWLGGFAAQNDSAQFWVTLTGNTGGATIVKLIGPNAAQRGSVTKFLRKALTGVAVPANTTKISFQLRFTRVEGSYNDGYADALSVVLTGV